MLMESINKLSLFFYYNLMANIKHPFEHKNHQILPFKKFILR